MRRILIFALMAHVLFSAFAVAKQIPTEYFTKSAEFETIKLSPEGKYFAVTMPQENGNVLAIFDKATFKPTYVYRFPEFSYVSYFFWATEERVVFTRKFKKKDDEGYYTEGQIYAGNFDGSHSHVVFGVSANLTSAGSANMRKNKGPDRSFANILHSLPDDEDHIIISARHMDNDYDAPRRLIKLNIKTGKRKTITRTPFGNIGVGFNRQGKPIFATGTDHKGKDRKFFFKDNSWKEITENDPLHNYEFLTSNSAGDKLYLQSYVDGHTDAMFEYDFKTQKIDLVFNHPISDIHAFIREPDTRTIVGVEVMPDTFEYHYLDAKNEFVTIHKSLAKALKGSDITITSYTRDLKQMLVLVQTDKNPGDFYLFDREKKNLEYIFSRKEWLDPDLLSSRTPISFEARDGQTIYGYITKPVNMSKPVPLVSYVHGGPFGVRDTWYYDTMAQFLANRGFAVLQVNYRGSGGYGLKYETVAYQKRHSLIQHDIIDGTKWALSRDDISDKACIMGWSFGGYSALMAPLVEPELFKCSIAAAGVYDALLQEQEADYSEVDSVAKGAAAVKYGIDEDLLRKESPLTYIDNLKIPIMIVHGGKDTRVPPEQAKLLRKALDERNLPYEWLFKENEGHSFYNEKNRLEYYNKSVEFLNKHLN